MAKIMKMLLLFLIIVLGAAISGCSSAPETAPQTAPETATEPVIAPNMPAPDFQLQSLDGQDITMSGLLGKPVMLNFWASWCGPCRYEMPFFQEVYEDVKWEAANLVILAVNLGESPAVARGFIEGNGYTFPVLLDMIGEVGDMYNVRSYPTTFFIDEHGIIRDMDVGAFRSKAHLEQRLDDLIFGE